MLAERFAASDVPLPELRVLTLVVRGWPVKQAERGVGEHVARLAETLLDRARFPSLERVVVKSSAQRYGPLGPGVTISSGEKLAAWRTRTCVTVAGV